VAEARYRLGNCYYSGQGVDLDFREAVKWYYQAAKQQYIRFPEAEAKLGECFAKGRGVEKNSEEAGKWYCTAARHSLNSENAVDWYRKAAELDNAFAAYNLGMIYAQDHADPQKQTESVKWFRKAAEQGHAASQEMLGLSYSEGIGVEQNYKEGVKWFCRAAEQGDASAQYSLAVAYGNGNGVIEDYVEAYKWTLLAGMNGMDSNSIADSKRWLKYRMSPEQVVEAQKLAKEFVARKESVASSDTPVVVASVPEQSKALGTAFFIDNGGYLVTAHHVIEGAKRIKIKTAAGMLAATVLFGDAATDIAILKVDGDDFSALALAASSAVKTGDKICTIGYPNIQMQGQEPKYTEGVISSLSGPGNNPRYFQISTAVQPGNSGGPLVNEQGQVVGVVTARLSDAAAISETGAIPQNVNYAVKSAFVLPFVENIPEIKQAAKPAFKDRAEIIEQMKKATVLVRCY
jgi:TPR repeat protein